MVDRFQVLMVGLLGAVLIGPVHAFAQNSSTPTWPDPVPDRRPVAEKDKKPAPRRTVVGMRVMKLATHESHRGQGRTFGIKPWTWNRCLNPG